MSATELDFQFIKSIEQPWKDLVKGFLREFVDYDDIPSLIIYTCLVFYYQQEYFNNIADIIKVNNLKTEISNKEMK